MINLDDLPLLSPSEIIYYQPSGEGFDRFYDKHKLSEYQMDYSKKLKIFKADY